jgi:hypothetical protein
MRESVRQRCLAPRGDSLRAQQADGDQKPSQHYSRKKSDNQEHGCWRSNRAVERTATRDAGGMLSSRSVSDNRQASMYFMRGLPSYDKPIQ